MKGFTRSRAINRYESVQECIPHSSTSRAWGRKLPAFCPDRNSAMCWKRLESSLEPGGREGVGRESSLDRVREGKSASEGRTDTGSGFRHHLCSGGECGGLPRIVEPERSKPFRPEAEVKRKWPVKLGGDRILSHISISTPNGCTCRLPSR